MGQGKVKGKASVQKKLIKNKQKSKKPTPKLMKNMNNVQQAMFKVDKKINGKVTRNLERGIVEKMRLGRLTGEKSPPNI